MDMILWVRKLHLLQFVSIFREGWPSSLMMQRKSIWLYRVSSGWRKHEMQFFRWCKCIEDIGDDKDGTIARQRNNICSLEKCLMMSRKWIKMLLVGLCVVVVINLAMLIIFLKFPWVTSEWMFWLGLWLKEINVICISVLSWLCLVCNMYPEICINEKWFLASGWHRSYVLFSCLVVLHNFKVE